MNYKAGQTENGLYILNFLNILNILMCSMKKQPPAVCYEKGISEDRTL